MEFNLNEGQELAGEGEGWMRISFDLLRDSGICENSGRTRWVDYPLMSTIISFFLFQKKALIKPFSSLLHSLWFDSILLRKFQKFIVKMKWKISDEILLVIGSFLLNQWLTWSLRHLLERFLGVYISTSALRFHVPFSCDSLQFWQISKANRKIQARKCNVKGIRLGHLQSVYRS